MSSFGIKIVLCGKAVRLPGVKYVKDNQNIVVISCDALDVDKEALQGFQKCLEQLTGPAITNVSQRAEDVSLVLLSGLAPSVDLGISRRFEETLPFSFGYEKPVQDLGVWKENLRRAEAVRPRKVPPITRSRR